jgi:PAS domain S-box-containing protein
MSNDDSSSPEQPSWLNQMESVLEVLNEGVLVIDETRRVLFANSRFREMTGFTSQDLEGDGISLFYSPQEWAFLMRQSDLSFRAGRNRYVFSLARKNGGRLPVIISSQTLQNSAGQFGVATFTDISEQVRVEEELRGANAKLQQRQLEIEEDLRLAARVQNSLRPSSLNSNTLRVEAFYHPVHSIGGDFAFVNSQDSDHVSLLICDVSGHGIGSALVANRIYSETTAHLRSGISLGKMFRELNRLLLEDIAGSGMFVTATAARINIPRRRMVFAGAGHPPAILARQGQNPLLLESQSMILGAFPEAVDSASSQEVQLEPDDRVIFYTDGITEVFDYRGEMLGILGIQEIVRKSSSLPAEEMKQAILDGVTAWRNGPPTDDVSLLLVQIQ